MRAIEKDEEEALSEDILQKEAMGYLAATSCRIFKTTSTDKETNDEPKESNGY